MNGIYKLIAAGFLGSLFILPYMAGTRGYGLGTERNAEIVKQSLSDCPPEARDPATGRCKRSIRGVRNRTGRGYGFGK